MLPESVKEPATFQAKKKMIEKRFRVLCTDSEYLKAELISQALLEQITLGNNKPHVFFGVIEERDDKPVIEQGID